MHKIIKLLSSNLYALSLYSRQIAGILVLFVIARYLSVYDYGVFTSYKAIATFILVLANMGYESYTLVSAQNNVKKIRLKLSLFLTNAVSLILLTTLFLPILPLENKYLFFLVLLRTFLDSTLFALVLPYFQASRKFNIIAFINIIYAIFICGIACAAYIFKLSLVKFLYLNIVLGIINFVQLSFYLKINYNFVFYKFKKLIKYIDTGILSYMLVNICFILYSQIASIYVSTFVAKEEAALYFAAFTVANIAMLFIGAKMQKVMPEFVEVSVTEAPILIKREIKSLLILLISIFLFFVLFGKLILKLLYSQDYYINAYNILLILNLGNISYGIGKIYITYIMAKNKANHIWKMQIEAILISILTLLIFNKSGIYAAALAYFLSATHIGIRYVLKTKKLLKQKESLEKYD